MYFQNYGLRKRWLCKCLKMLVSEDVSTSNMLNGSKHCLNLHSSTFNIFIGKLTTYSLKKSFFMICKILGPFFNTLTSNVKSSLLNIDNLAQPIHMQLSNEQKSIFRFFSTSLKSRANFEHL